MLQRRHLLAAATRTLKYVPHANLPSLDPFTNTACVARNHGGLAYD